MMTLNYLKLRQIQMILTFNVILVYILYDKKCTARLIKCVLTRDKYLEKIQ